MSEKSGKPPPSGPPDGGSQGGTRRPADGPQQPGPGGAAGAPGGDDPLRGSRTSGVWLATATIGILLVLLVIFIVQNTQEVDIAFLVWEGRWPLAAAILIAAAAGILITTTAGGLRILQLRRRVRRETKAAKKAGKGPRRGAGAPGQSAPGPDKK